MLGSKGENEAGMGGGGYNNAPAQDTYSQPAPSQATPQAAPKQAAPTTIPEIDINEDEIPF
jgi:single-stranded DNA-binding protein